MGSKSRSSSTTTTTTEQRDERVAATDQAVVVQLDDGSQITLTDPGILEAGGAALDKFGEVLTETLGFAAERAEESAGLVRDVLAADEEDSLTTLKFLGTAAGLTAVAALAISRFSK